MQIRRLEKQDLEYANKLRNEYLDFLRQEFPHNLEQQIKWFESTKDIYWLIYTDELGYRDNFLYSNYTLGIIGLTNIDLKNRKAELSLITEDYLDNNIADFGLDLVEKYAFEKLSLHKLFITVYPFDKKKNKYFENRYNYKFNIIDDVFYQGRYWNHYYYYLLENEWRNNNEIKKDKEYWNNFIDDC